MMSPELRLKLHHLNAQAAEREAEQHRLSREVQMTAQAQRRAPSLIQRARVALSQLSAPPAASPRPRHTHRPA